MATAEDILGLNRKPRVPRQWAAHYRQLCAERDRLAERDRSTPQVSSTKMDELAEAGAEESQRSMSWVAASATQEVLYEVVGALQRIERGVYGICEITGEQIEAARLEAIPWARYSLRGQNELEQGGHGRRTGIPALQSVEAEASDAEDGEDEAESE
jgi:RNA polymerase-binding transcription factor DksA